MGCVFSRSSYNKSRHNFMWFLNDLAFKMNIDVIGIYSNPSKTPITLYNDSNFILFGKRYVKANTYNNFICYTLQYHIPKCYNSRNRFVNSDKPLLDILKAFFVSKICYYPIEIKYHYNEGKDYFEIVLFNINIRGFTIHP